MSEVVNNFITTNNYVDAPNPVGGVAAQGTIRVAARKISLYIYNAAIYLRWQNLTHNLIGSHWEPELMLQPGVYFFVKKVQAVQIRSAVANIPATVTVELTRMDE